MSLVDRQGADSPCRARFHVAVLVRPDRNVDQAARRRPPDQWSRVPRSGGGRRASGKGDRALIAPADVTGGTSRTTHCNQTGCGADSSRCGWLRENRRDKQVLPFWGGSSLGFAGERWNSWSCPVTAS